MLFSPLPLVSLSGVVGRRRFAAIRGARGCCATTSAAWRAAVVYSASRETSTRRCAACGLRGGHCAPQRSLRLVRAHEDSDSERCREHAAQARPHPLRPCVNQSCFGAWPPVPLSTHLRGRRATRISAHF
ncbi:LOW QUALITY PROTEIN: hypothetical protein Q4I29_005455 [Leishmania shawi]|uniref:Secreted protein n=1 Tax=Leishmania shawi TaxID=5680 RepID=A0ABR3E405_9TRYP